MADGISPRTLLPRIGTPLAPVLVDICIPEDVAADPDRIPGALRHDWRDLAGLAERLHGRDAVVICQKGAKLSQGVASWLDGAGQAARFLEGGMMAWRALPGAPCVPETALPDAPGLRVTGTGRSLADLAAIWLVRRFLDPEARILRVAEAEISATAARFGAVPLWPEDAAPMSARLAACGLDIPALVALCDRIDAPSGDLADLIHGLARLNPSERGWEAAGLPVIDALYAGICRHYLGDDATGRGGAAR